MLLTPSTIGAIQQDPLRRIFKQASLDLQFAERKSLVDATTGANLVDFTRASSGTYVGSDGLIKTATTNAPRFDHDPTTGESLGLLVEESRTNLIVNSENLSGTGWAGGGTATLDSAIADPTGVTGTVYYPSISERTTTFNANGASQIAVSCFVKQRSGETNDTAVQIYQSVTGTVVFLGAITLPLAGAFTPSGNFSNGTRTEYPNGWYRFTFIANADAGQGTGTFTTAGRFDVEGGDSTNYIWGIQVENASFPTSYIPTEGSTVTRAADVTSISGSNFSSWYRQDEGTVFADVAVTLPASGGNQFVFRASDNSYNNAIAWNIKAAGFAALDTNAGGVFNGVASNITALPANLPAKFAAGYQANNLALSLSGATSLIDTSATIPTALTRADIGSDHAGVNRIKAGTIRRLTYWPARLPNEVLQTITQ